MEQVWQCSELVACVVYSQLVSFAFLIRVSSTFLPCSVSILSSPHLSLCKRPFKLVPLPFHTAPSHSRFHCVLNYQISSFFSMLVSSLILLFYTLCTSKHMFPGTCLEFQIVTDYIRQCGPLKDLDAHPKRKTIETLWLNLCNHITAFLNLENVGWVAAQNNKSFPFLTGSLEAWPPKPRTGSSASSGLRLNNRITPLKRLEMF